MRCPNCNKYTGIDADADPELDADTLDIEVEAVGADEAAEVEVPTFTCRIVNACSECGTELKAADLDLGGQTLTLPAECQRCKRNPANAGTLVADLSAERVESWAGSAHLYGAEVVGTITCPYEDCSEAVATFTCRDDIRASDMEDC